MKTSKSQSSNRRPSRWLSHWSFPGRRAEARLAKSARPLLALLSAFGSLISACAQDAPASTQALAPIPFPELGAKVAAQYQGDGLSIIPAGDGARLNCVFQKLQGQATPEGLWLFSTADDAKPDRFRVVASSVGREEGDGRARHSVRAAPPQNDDGAHGVTRPTKALPPTGTIFIQDNSVRFTRPGLIEEYSVSVDGVRQDFVVLDRPKGEGRLRVELEVSGAKAEPLANGAQLVLEKSGRKIAYSRLRATDATGKELPARMDVIGKSEIRIQNSEMALAVAVADGQAVYPIRIDPTFSDANWISLGGISGANAYVFAAAADVSGNLYIAGEFTVVGDIVANRVAKWNGSSWSALGSGMNGGVGALAIAGSDLYAGGFFTTAGGSPATNVAKWNGTSWSALGSGIGAGINNAVGALAVSGSVLYAGGSFTKAGGSPATNIAKWNGISWSALGSGMDNEVHALAVSGGDLYAGGSFTTAGGSPATNIAKWNGSSWSALGSGMGIALFFTPNVYALAVSGSDLYAGGFFTTAGGSPANYIAKWNGSSWSALGSGMNASVQALAVLGGDLYAGGSFTNAGGSAANRIAKWNGSAWSALGAGTEQDVSALAVSGGNLYAGGLFTSAGGSPATYIAKWSGSSWSALSSGMNDRVRALAVSGSNLYVGGNFTIAGGSGANHIAKWNGSGWSPLGLGMNDIVRALAVSGSDLYAGGDFTMAGGSGADYIAKWNGSSWSALGSGMGDSVFALAVSGSDLYAGGEFSTAGGSGADYIAKWNGSSWSALGSGMGDSVFALAVSGSDLYAGGLFTSADGNSAHYIAKWNGISWSALGSGMDDEVDALAVLGGDLYAGGRFLTAGGSGADYIAKWNGSSWSPLGSGMGGFVNGFRGVQALAVSGSDLYAGGRFLTAGGSAANFIAKWNGSSWSPLGSGMDGGLYFGNAVHALAASGSDLYAGGGCTIAGGKASAFVARAVLGDAPGCNRLTTTLASGGTMQLSYIGYPATNYALERSFNLAPPVSWLGQQTNTMSVSGVLLFTNTPAPGTNNFWRVRSIP